MTPGEGASLSICESDLRVQRPTLSKKIDRQTCCRFGRSSERFFDLPIAENDAPQTDITDAHKISCKLCRHSEYESEFRGFASSGVRGCTAWFSRRAVPSALAIKTLRKQRGAWIPTIQSTARTCVHDGAQSSNCSIDIWNCLFCIAQVINCAQTER